MKYSESPAGLIPQGIARLRERIRLLEADREALIRAGFGTGRVDRHLEAKRRALAALQELAAHEVAP